MYDRFDRSSMRARAWPAPLRARTAAPAPPRVMADTHVWYRYAVADARDPAHPPLRA